MGLKVGSNRNAYKGTNRRNRTTVGLKAVQGVGREADQLGRNRTTVGLKDDDYNFLLKQTEVAIAPQWD